MKDVVEIKTWEGLALYGLGLVVGLAVGGLIRWAWSS